MQVDKVVKDMMRTDQAREAFGEELDVFGKDITVLMAEMIQLGVLSAVANDKGALHHERETNESQPQAHRAETLHVIRLATDPNMGDMHGSNGARKVGSTPTLAPVHCRSFATTDWMMYRVEK